MSGLNWREALEEASDTALLFINGLGIKRDDEDEAYIVAREFAYVFSDVLIKAVRKQGEAQPTRWGSAEKLAKQEEFLQALTDHLNDALDADPNQ